MTLPTVRSVGEADAEQAVSVLTLAFSTDPVIRALYPDTLDHLTHFPKMMRINIVPAMAHHAVHYVDGFSAAAIWFPPIRSDVDAEAAKSRGRQLGKLMGDTASKEGNDDFYAALGDVEAGHPKEPHWYLSAIGVDPHHQNEGLGSILMEHALPKCDEDNALAYLESSSPRNVPFYHRHGFEVIQVVQVGSSPIFTLMVREPR